MESTPDPGRLADLVEKSSVAIGEDDLPDEPARRGPVSQTDDLGGVSAELSLLLAELARTPDAEVDVAEGWTPGVRPGDTVGRFLLKRELGRGGFGVVYEAIDNELGRAVAFKAVRPGRRITARGEAWLRSEAEAVARLNHPNIVTLHDFGRGPSGPYLIFELLHGETLADRLRAGPLPVREALRVAVDVARVLSHAHGAGVVHRDLKPGNVFLCQDGAVKVLDFGLAYLFGRGGPVSGGTPAYMAPEQWRSEPGDERTDVFALGVLLHQMISGGVPYRVLREGSKERSEAQQPGPAPTLAPGAAPAGLRRLVARMLEKDPEDRPRTAEEVLRELRRAERRLEGRGRRVGLAAAVALVLALVLGAAAAWMRAPSPRDGRLVVAVADFENGTGEEELDGLSGLLVTSLEQSRRFQVLTRSRLLALLRQLGKGDAPRIDAELARELARAAGAQVVLAGTARRAGEAFALELRGLDAAENRALFSMKESAPAKGEVFGAIDRLSDGVRKALQEQEEDIRGSRIRVAQAVTSSPEAYRAYYEGIDCVDRPSRAGSWAAVGGACAVHFRRALALDPTFALAHYQLAQLLHREGRPASEVSAALEAAQRSLGRAPPKEAALIRAWSAHVGGRDEEALAEYVAVLAEFPEEEQALQLAGYVLYERGRWAEAAPYFEKALVVDPGAEWPIDYLVPTLARLRRWEALRELVRLAEVEPASAARRHAVVRGLVWLGEPEEAVAVARRSVERGDGHAASLDLAGALLVAGDLAEARTVLERAVAAKPNDAGTVYALARVLGALGRRREGLALIDAIGARAEAQDQGVVQYARTIFLAGDLDSERLWREAARTGALAPRLAADLAVVLALRGERARAARLAANLEQGSTIAEEYAALVAWREGDGAGAAARLAAIEAGDPWPDGGIAPAYLIAEVSAAEGDWKEAAAASKRFRALWPKGLSASWTLPRAVYLSALAHEQLGEWERAREEADLLLDWLREADPGHRLADEARTLRRRVGR